jgi:hypothetical protein
MHHLTTVSLIQTHVASNGGMVMNDEMKSMSKEGVAAQSQVLFCITVFGQTTTTRTPKFIHPVYSVLRSILEADTCQI